MSFTIGSRKFEGPFEGSGEIADEPGVFFVVCPDSDGGLFLVDVEESDRLRTALRGHDRKDCWAKVCVARYKTPQFGVLYTHQIPQNYRRSIVHKIREEYKPPCGGV